MEKEFDESLREQHREPSQPPRAPQSSHKNQKSAMTSSKQGESGSNSQHVSQRRTRSSTGFVPHQELNHYIEEVHQVVGDGNCGFRAISMHLHGREDYHHGIRMDLINEMKDHRQLYISLLGGFSNYDAMMNGLNVSSECDVGKDKWLRFPSMGCIIASKYNVVVISVPSLTTGECITFLPYHSSPPTNISVWAIGLNANKDHFVQVKLRKGSLLPPVYPLWHRHSNPVAGPWKDVISDRLKLYTPLLPKAKTEGETIVVD